MCLNYTFCTAGREGPVAKKNAGRHRAVNLPSNQGAESPSTLKVFNAPFATTHGHFWSKDCACRGDKPSRPSGGSQGETAVPPQLPTFGAGQGHFELINLIIHKELQQTD
jgi:hypothetical protein